MCASVFFLICCWKNYILCSVEQSFNFTAHQMWVNKCNIQNNPIKIWSGKRNDFTDESSVTIQREYRWDWFTAHNTHSYLYLYTGRYWAHKLRVPVNELIAFVLCVHQSNVDSYSIYVWTIKSWTKKQWRKTVQCWFRTGKNDNT